MIDCLFRMLGWHAHTKPQTLSTCPTKSQGDASAIILPLVNWPLYKRNGPGSQSTKTGMNYCLSSLALGYELNFLPPSPTRDTNQRSQWRCRSTAPDLEKCSPVYLHHPLPSGYPPKHELHLTLKSTSEGGQRARDHCE